MKFIKENARKFGWEGINGWAYFSKEEFSGMSCAYIIVEGRHGRIKNLKSDRLYFIIEGRGEFTVNGRQMKVKPGDVVVIPKNTPYDYKGKMKVLLVDSPAFDPKADIKME